MYSNYEPYYQVLENYTRFDYLSADDSTKAQMIDQVFNIYRSVNEYPIPKFTDEEAVQEVIKCYNKEIDTSKDFMSLKFNQGSGLCRHIFPNLRDTVQAGDPRTLNAKFFDDHMLKRAIEFCLKFKTSKCPVKPSGIKDGLEMLGGGVATNFKPMSAKWVYDKYCPQDATVYDFSSRFGGRILGAASSTKVSRYIGTDPNTVTFNNQKKLKAVIQSALPDFKIGLHNLPSEEATLPTGLIDLAFSSPPYFDLEVYTEEATQSVVKFPKYLDWLEGYVRPTLTNIHNSLKSNGLLALNIADYNFKSRTVYMVDDWIRIANDVGFNLIDTVPMRIQTRRGVGHGPNTKEKQEGIYIFNPMTKDA